MLQEVWDSKWITNNGSFHKQLEKALAEYRKYQVRALTPVERAYIATLEQEAKKARKKGLTNSFFFYIIFTDALDA